MKSIYKVVPKNYRSGGSRYNFEIIFIYNDLPNRSDVGYWNDYIRYNESLDVYPKNNTKPRKFTYDQDNEKLLSDPFNNELESRYLEEPKNNHRNISASSLNAGNKEELFINRENRSMIKLEKRLRSDVLSNKFQKKNYNLDNSQSDASNQLGQKESLIFGCDDKETYE